MRRNHREQRKGFNTRNIAAYRCVHAIRTQYLINERGCRSFTACSGYADNTSWTCLEEEPYLLLNTRPIFTRHAQVRRVSPDTRNRNNNLGPEKIFIAMLAKHIRYRQTCK